MPSDHALYVPSHSTSVGFVHGLQAKSAMSPATRVSSAENPKQRPLEARASPV